MAMQMRNTESPTCTFVEIVHKKLEIPVKTENANSKYIVNIYYFKVLMDVEAE